jgi:formylmethanofuran dehydrogenase subunit E
LSRIQFWEQQFKDAARFHGDECVGLAIGVRAVDIVVRELELSGDTRTLEVKLGTKSCLGDAFVALLRLEKKQVEYMNGKDIIHVKKGAEEIELRLTPKKIREVHDVFDKSEEDLFPTVRRRVGDNIR